MIKIEKLNFKTVFDSEIEIVERKGLGHPDTICDSLAEEFSWNLSQFYFKNFGFILHHNVDKAVLIGGRAEPKFGGGEVLEPIEIKIVGRAITKVKNRKIPIEKIYLQTSKKFIKENFRFLNPEKHIKFSLGIKEGSIDLVGLFERNLNSVPVSNDTSFGVGFAPLTLLENLVLNLELYFNSSKFKSRYKFVGEDIKVMGLRLKDKYRITIACAFIDKFILNIIDYQNKKEILRREVEKFSKKFIDIKNLEIFINTADILDNEVVYITVTGTSAEAGDDGQVGRGNRVNGLITPYRPMSLEAAAGKNPVSHVGKIYNIFANEIANEIVSKINGVKEAYVYMVSQIGKPINEPQIIDIQLKYKNSSNIKSINKKIEKLTQKHLDLLAYFWKKVLDKKIKIC